MWNIVAYRNKITQSVLMTVFYVVAAINMIGYIIISIIVMMNVFVGKHAIQEVHSKNLTTSQIDDRMAWAWITLNCVSSGNQTCYPAFDAPQWQKQWFNLA